MKLARIKKLRVIVYAAVLTLSAGVAGFLGYQKYGFLQYELSLEKEFTVRLTDVIGSLKKQLVETRGERDQLKQKLLDEEGKVSTLGSQVQGITSAVGSLQKLNKIDPEILKKYSKVYFLNENYSPQNLVMIDRKYISEQKKELLFRADVLPYLYNLLLDASSANIDLKIVSAYRSFYEQEDLKTSYKMVYGSGANKFSADQGYSEHQLGTTVDFTTMSLGTTNITFAKMPSYAWLEANAYKYGFILSYPKNNTYYIYEPWHWRFVGRALAQKLHDENKNFYDLDQREIDTYRISFFD